MQQKNLIKDFEIIRIKANFCSVLLNQAKFSYNQSVVFWI